MYALPARIPDVEVPRSEIIPNRVARKLAPLFGVIWDENPFGRTWVCDYGTVTLAEIIRGAPLPGRAEQAALDAAAERGTTWKHAGRAVWTPRRAPTPAALSNASINRYGPDTKAATVLTGVNVLLRDATGAIADVCRHMHATGTGTGIQYAVWAGLVLEVFRAQPALVMAGVQARAVQRSLKFPWRSLVDAHQVEGAARCEVNAGDEDTEADQPHRLDLIDATLPLLIPRAAVDPLDTGLSSTDIRGAIADRWAQRLLEIGRPGRGIVWLTERPTGHREVQAYLRVGSAVAPFVAELRHLWPDEEPGTLPQPPDDLADAPLATRRAHLIAVHIAVNYLRFRDDLLQGPHELRRSTLAMVAAAGRQARDVLGPQDPVTTVLGAYASYLDLTDLNRDRHPDPALIGAAVREVIARQREVTEAWRGGRLDPGTAAYLLEVSNVEAARARGVLDDPRPVDRALASGWREHLRARGIDPDRDVAALTEAQRYHLQNYSDYLAGLGGGDRLRRAFRIQRLVVDIRERVTEAEPAGYVAKYTASRTSHEVAARIATALLDVVGPDEAPTVLEAGLHHVEGVLANPTTEQLLLSPQSDGQVAWTALNVLPLIAAAAESGRSAQVKPLLERGLVLLEEARNRVAPGSAERAKLDELAARLAAST